MAVVRLEALRALEIAIECAIPALKGKICVGQAPVGHRLEYPSLSIDPVRWKYAPDQAQETVEIARDRVVMNVGRHTATIQIEIVAADLSQRYELEQKVIDLFLSTPLHPGVLLTPVSACPALGTFIAAWEYDEDEWIDVAAHDGKFISRIIFDGIIPALVTRGEAYTIEQLQLGLTQDFEKVFDKTTFNSDPAVDVIQIKEDGTFTSV